MSQLSPRERRALGIGVLALVVIAVAGVIYLRSGTQPLSKATPEPTNPQSVQRIADIVAYDFAAPPIGWAVEGIVARSRGPSPFWVLRTTDGGKHWQRQLSGQSGFIFETIDTFHMLDTQNGFVVAGDPLKVYRTVDGGVHWATLELPSQDAIQITFSDPQHGWVVAQSRTTPSNFVARHLYTTIDAGNSWTPLPDPPADLQRIAFRKTSEGWAGAGGPGQPRVYTSEDGGNTWTKHELQAPPGYLAQDLYSTSLRLLPGVGAAATISYRGAIFELTSFDRGATWRFIAPPTGVVSSTYTS